MPPKNRIKDKFPKTRKTAKKKAVRTVSPLPDAVSPHIFVLNEDGTLSIQEYEYDPYDDAVYLIEPITSPEGAPQAGEDEDQDEEDNDESFGESGPIDGEEDITHDPLDIEALLDMLDPDDRELAEERFRKFGVYGLVIVLGVLRCYKFESMSDIIRSLKEELPFEFERILRGCEKRDQVEEYYGMPFNKWSDLTDLFKKGWPEGVAIFNQMLAELMSQDLPLPPSQQRRSCYAELHGEDLDYDRFRSGQDYWSKYTREASTGINEVPIFIDVTAHYKRTTKESFWRGVAGLCLAKILEQQGYRVEIWLVVSAQTIGNKMLIACRLKRLGDPLNIDNLVMAVSTWMFRGVLVPSCFALMKKAGVPEMLAYDQGQAPINPEELKLLAAENNYILVENFYNKHMALDFVIQELNKIKELHR